MELLSWLVWQGRHREGAVVQAVVCTLMSVEYAVGTKREQKEETSINAQGAGGKAALSQARSSCLMPRFYGLILSLE